MNFTSSGDRPLELYAGNNADVAPPALGVWGYGETAPLNICQAAAHAAEKN